MNDNLIQEAFEYLFPDRTYSYTSKLIYTGKFSDYNGNIRLSSSMFLKKIEVRLSKKYLVISKEIQLGIIQDLLAKVFKSKRRTLYMDLYHNFVKSLHLSISKHTVDPVLEELFLKLNEIYFEGLLEMPNLIWGRYSKVKLGSYNFKQDTISISTALQNSGILLEYVLYHEMLHKKHKFKVSKGTTRYHFKEFNADELQFPNAKELEKELSKYLAKLPN